MAELMSRKIIKIGGSSGITIPKEYIDDAKRNGSKKIWVAVLTQEESPKSKDLIEWIKKN